MSVRSKIYRLDLRDFLKGLIVAVFSSVTAMLLESYNKGEFVLNWNNIGVAAFIGSLGYLKTNLLSNSKGEFLKKDLE